MKPRPRVIFDRDTYHKFNVVSHERDCHERHLDDDGEQVGQAEAEDGPVDARVAERLRPQDGGDHERVADEAEDEVEGGQRPDDGGGLESDAHRGNVCKGAIDAGGPLGYFHCADRGFKGTTRWPPLAGTAGGAYLPYPKRRLRCRSLA